MTANEDCVRIALASNTFTDTQSFKAINIVLPLKDIVLSRRRRSEVNLTTYSCSGLLEMSPPTLAWATSLLRRLLSWRIKRRQSLVVALMRLFALRRHELLTWSVRPGHPHKLQTIWILSRLHPIEPRVTTFQLENHRFLWYIPPRMQRNRRRLANLTL